MKPDRRETRRLRMLALISERFQGRQVDFANHVGVVPNLVSRYARGTKGIGEDMRDKIEHSCALPKGWLDEAESASPYLKSTGSDPLYVTEPNPPGIFHGKNAPILPHDPAVITSKDISIMGYDGLPSEFRFECDHDLPGEAGDLSIPKGHFAVMDSTVTHRQRDIVLVAFPDGALSLRRVVQGEDGRPYLLGAGAVAPLTDRHKLLAVAVGASTPRLKRTKKAR